MHDTFTQPFVLLLFERTWNSVCICQTLIPYQLGLIIFTVNPVELYWVQKMSTHLDDAVNYNFWMQAREMSMRCC